MFVKFTHSTGYCGCDTEEVFEFEEGTSEGEIEEELESWAAEQDRSGYFWEEISEEEKDNY
jgi:hypothetical protein